MQQPWSTILVSIKSVTPKYAADSFKDGRVRNEYKKRIEKESEDILKDVKEGKMSSKNGAKLAVETRNKTMREFRTCTSDRGCAVAETHKLEEKTYEDLSEHYSEKLFKKKYEDLSDSEKEQVYFEIIESSGRSNKNFDEITKKKWENAKRFLCADLSFSFFEILLSQHPIKEMFRQGSIRLGAMLGGEAAGLLRPSLCRPGDPSSVDAVVFAGSIAGGLSAESIVNSCDEELEGSENGKSRRVLQPGADR